MAEKVLVDYKGRCLGCSKTWTGLSVTKLKNRAVQREARQHAKQCGHGVGWTTNEHIGARAT